MWIVDRALVRFVEGLYSTLWTWSIARTVAHRVGEFRSAAQAGESDLDHRS